MLNIKPWLGLEAHRLEAHGLGDVKELVIKNGLLVH